MLGRCLSNFDEKKVEEKVMLDNGSSGGTGYNNASISHHEQITSLKARCMGDKEMFGS